MLSKTLGTVAILPNFLAASSMIGCLLMLTRYAAAGRKLAIGCTVALAVCGFTPVGSLLLRPLEDRFPPWLPGADAPTGIVILGGSTKPDISAAHGRPVSDIGVDRLITGAMLARRYPNARIIYSSGNPNLLPGNLRKADYALQILGELGISKDRVQIEGDSRNTAENAILSRAAASPKPGDRWLLVTSAYHMPRAVGLFRAADFPVEPVPTGWLTGGHTTWLDFGNFASSVLLVHIASREWIGLAAYRALGRTNAFLPGP
ncbi:MULTISPECIES: YdcF family protein [unclassified Bradyrhizobium]|uniref:YdcF family protein n=1 Tax=unclassified Bradyrhizobium TaxID=2631580 RepID=UPI00247B23FC|nr:MULTISPECIES: YdcF family protein [unclassified Bradyrhizobium]WGR67822.1 YdcF family protein [Bradyrhizobium sp. ISRA426]WGR79875.1 YdcF family protein [Bradyrhizobium sp. ISRA430]WGR83061.1 YdcF family protein [Bradyrhizobium sp. ISRA432]